MEKFSSFVFVFLGPPGAGKGLLASRLSDRKGMPHISTGNLLREECRKDSPLGREVKELIEKGHLVSDECILKVLQERLRREDCRHGCILDGFPRTAWQAVLLDNLVDSERQIPIEVTLDDKVIEERLSGRRLCPSCSAGYHVTYAPPRKANICDHCSTPLILRKDDAPEIVRERLRIFREQYAPLIDHYRSGERKPASVSSLASPDECFADLLFKIESRIPLSI